MLGLRVRALRLALCVLGLVVGLAILVAAGAFASWSATVTSGTTNFPAATAQTLPTGATPTKPVGLVYVGLAHASGVRSTSFNWSGTRTEVQSRSAKLALNLVRLHLLEK